MSRQVSRWWKFRNSVVEPLPVGSEPHKQTAARALTKARQVCAYETIDGLIGEVGLPAKPEHAGRIFKRPRAHRGA